MHTFCWLIQRSQISLFFPPDVFYVLYILCIVTLYTWLDTDWTLIQQIKEMTKKEKKFSTVKTLYLILEDISLLGCNSLVIITFCTKDSFFLCMLVLSIRYYWYYYHCYCLFLYFEFCTFYSHLDFLSKNLSPASYCSFPPQAVW